MASAPTRSSRTCCCSFPTGNSGEHRPVDINALVEESLNLAYHGARAEKQGFTITLERSFDPTAGEVDLFPQEITQSAAQPDLKRLLYTGHQAESRSETVKERTTKANACCYDQEHLTVTASKSGCTTTAQWHPAGGEGEAVQPVLYDKACR